MPMIPRQLKQLWEIRFKKILSLETESMDFYSGLLRHNADFLEGTEAKKLLQSIRKDEIKHIQIAKELVRIVQEKKLDD